MYEVDLLRASFVAAFFSCCLQIVAGREEARKVVQILMDNPDAFYACDTEVSEIDLKVNQYMKKYPFFFSALLSRRSACVCFMGTACEGIRLDARLCMYPVGRCQP